MAQEAQQYPQQEPWHPGPDPALQQSQAEAPHYAQPQYQGQVQGQPYQNPPAGPQYPQPYAQPQYQPYPPAPQQYPQQPYPQAQQRPQPQPQYQAPPQQYAAPPQQQYPQAYAQQPQYPTQNPYPPVPPQQFAPQNQFPPAPPQQYPPQQYAPQNPYPTAPPQQYPPQNQYPPAAPPQQYAPQQPPPAPKVRDAFAKGAAPYLQPGEQVYYGFILKIDDTIEETPREFQIEIEGQHHALGDVHRASAKINKGMKWAANPLDALNERLAEKATEALSRHLAGPVFVGGWQSQAGLLVRYIRATSEDYGPGAYGAVTNQRYLVFRGARLGGSAMRLVYAVPRSAIAGVRLEGTKDAVLHGRTPRAELHFTDQSMVATMMPTKQGEQLQAAFLQPVHPPMQQQYQQQPMQHG